MTVSMTEKIWLYVNSYGKNKCKILSRMEDILRAIALDEESRAEYAAMRAYDEACSKKMLELVEA